MQANTPRPRSHSRFDSPVGPGIGCGLAESLPPPAPRSSAGSRPPRALRRSSPGTVLPASATQMATKRAVSRSRRSAASRSMPRARRRRHAVPVGLGVRRQLDRLGGERGVGVGGLADDAVEVCRRAAGAALAIPLLPADDRARDKRLARAPRGRRPRGGAARRRPARLMPAEFARSAPNRPRGSGMRGCGPQPASSTSATGSPTTSSTGSDSSTMRFTNEVLAPFSSRRRTRYGSSSSCEPTGA